MDWIKSKLIHILVVLSLCVICYTVGRSHVKVVTHTVVEEKIVEKAVEARHIDKIETRKPDGTVVIETRDRTVISSDKRTDKASETTIAPSKRDWAVGAAYKANWRDLKNPEYQVSVDRRIIGDVWVTGGYSTDKSLTIGVKVEF